MIAASGSSSPAQPVSPLKRCSWRGIVSTFGRVVRNAASAASRSRVSERTGDKSSIT